VAFKGRGFPGRNSMNEDNSKDIDPTSIKIIDHILIRDKETKKELVNKRDKVLNKDEKSKK
jgi:hypothetical protein